MGAGRCRWRESSSSTQRPPNDRSSCRPTTRARCWKLGSPTRRWTSRPPSSARRLLCTAPTRRAGEPDDVGSIDSLLAPCFAERDLVIRPAVGHLPLDRVGLLRLPSSGRGVLRVKLSHAHQLLAGWHGCCGSRNEADYLLRMKVARGIGAQRRIELTRSARISIIRLLLYKHFPAGSPNASLIPRCADRHAERLHQLPAGQ